MYDPADMVEEKPASAACDLPAAAGPAAPPSLDRLIKLLESSQSLDPKLTAELAPLSQDLLMEIDPRDATERMLTAQIIATFGRAMFLARHANHQKNMKWFSLYSRECDRAMKLYRLQMQTLTDYRRPRRTSFTTIRNANIAAQQVINPLPAPESYAQPVQQTQAPLPPQRRRPGRPKKIRAQAPPVA
jgi:hypothetical protein